VLAQMDRINELVDKVAKLEHLLSRNSGNSSMPPSTDDQPGKTPPKGKNRDRGGPKRAKGKQKGAPGVNLSWSDAPDDKRATQSPRGRARRDSRRFAGHVWCRRGHQATMDWFVLVAPGLSLAPASL